MRKTEERLEEEQEDGAFGLEDLGLSVLGETEGNPGKSWPRWRAMWGRYRGVVLNFLFTALGLLCLALAVLLEERFLRGLAVGCFLALSLLWVCTEKEG